MRFFHGSFSGRKADWIESNRLMTDRERKMEEDWVLPMNPAGQEGDHHEG
jgi:hypothetical protein